HFKHQKDDKSLAWDQYTSALATLSQDFNKEIKTLTKRRKDEAKAQIEVAKRKREIWLKVEVETAETFLKQNYVLKNQVVDAKRHHLQFSKSDQENKTIPSLISNEVNEQAMAESDDEDNMSPCEESSIRRERNHYREKTTDTAVPAKMRPDVSSDDDERTPEVDNNSPSYQINKKSNVFTNKDHVLFLKQYNSMIRESKWKLRSGNYVKDIMIELGKRCNFHHPLHSFIFDIEDNYTRSTFTEEELEEICAENWKDLPDFIGTFAKTSTSEIREQLNRSHVNLGGNYETSIHYSYDYVKATVGDWIRLIEKNPNPLTMDLSESWFRTNVWRAIDNVFDDMPYVFVVGEEVGGVATSERKNRYRMLGNETLEWAASEAGVRWEGPNGTKLLKEAGFSLPRQLKDIFIKLARKVDFDEDKIRQLNVPGFIHAGAVLIKVNLDNPKGYVMRYVKDTPCEVYADVNEFPRSLDTLITILYAKETILRTMNVIKSSDEHHEEEALKRWKRLGKAKRKHNRIELPDCYPTPKKNRGPKKTQKGAEPDNE
ncbi:5453_t:CDS:10, partial [Ambispora gerdemannii]